MTIGSTRDALKRVDADGVGRRLRQHRSWHRFDASRRAVALALASLVLSCATRDPNDYYDAAATESMGRIIAKQVIAVDRRPAADAKRTLFVPVTLGGIAYLVMLSNPMAATADIKIFEYVVRLADGTSTAVPSDYFAFEVGDCVRLLRSTRPTYPRIAPGWAC
jgi:hypothetical protein